MGPRMLEEAEDAHPQGGGSRPRSPWARLTDYLPTLYLLYILTYLLTVRPSVYLFGRARGLLAGTASDRGKSDLTDLI